DRDAARPIDPHTVAHRVRAAAAADLADGRDEAGLLQAGDHLRRGRLGHAGELAELVAGEGAVRAEGLQCPPVVSLAQPGRGAGGGGAHADEMYQETFFMDSLPTRSRIELVEISPPGHSPVRSREAQSAGVDGSTRRASSSVSSRSASGAGVAS